MPQGYGHLNKGPFKLPVLFLSSGIVLALFLWQGHLGFNLADEGFLWYGAQRVLQGEVPIRDFMAYDPGRYYWSAAWMALRGSDGIMALREAAAIFQALGLFIGLTLLLRYSPKQNALFWGLAAITLAVWMYPRHKLFDITVSMALVGALALPAARPTAGRYFLSGLVVGLAAIFGRNHGLYGLVAGLGVLVYLTMGRKSGPGWIRALTAWLGGILAGYLPLLIGLAVIPGFGQAYWESILFHFEVQTTNLPLPVPFPWRVPFEAIGDIHTWRGWLLGSFFVAILVLGILGPAWEIRKHRRQEPVSPAFVASAFLMLPYAHFAYSRADVNHLAQGIFPFLLGSLILIPSLAPPLKWPAALVLLFSALMVMLPWHPGWQSRFDRNWVAVEITGDRLKVEPGTVDDLDLIKRLVREYAPGPRTFFVAPYWPGAYAMARRQAPVWEIFPLLPRNESFQQAEINRIAAARPGFALLIDYPLDGIEARRFQNTHPFIDRYIRSRFDRVINSTINPAYMLFKPESALP